MGTEISILSLLSDNFVSLALYICVIGFELRYLERFS